MGVFRPALYSQLSRYKKRKTISLDGRVAGLPATAGGSRHYVDVQDGWLAMLPASDEHSIYDAHAHYQHTQDEYQGPPDSFVGMPTRGTPPLRLSPVPRGPRPPRPQYLLMDEDVMADAMANLPDSEAYDEWDVQDEFGYPEVMDDNDTIMLHSSEGLPVQEHEELATDMMSGMPIPAEEHPWFGEPQMTQDFFEDTMAETMLGDDLADDMHDDPTLVMGDMTSPYDMPFDGYAAEVAPFAEEPMQVGFQEDYVGSVDFDGQAELGYDQGFAKPMQEASVDQDAGFGLEAMSQDFAPAEMMQDMFDEPMGGLEAMVHEAMPEPEAPMPEPEPAPYEQPMPEDEMMMDPWQMPGGFGPGFGPMGPMPFGP